MNRPYHESDRGLYRSRNGVIFGVCRGIAEWKDLPVCWVRIAVVAVALLSGFWPAVIAYVFAAIFMKPSPVMPFKDELDKEFYDSYAHSRGMALKRLKSVADALERRTRRLESRVLDREADWERRFTSGRSQ